MKYICIDNQTDIPISHKITASILHNLKVQKAGADKQQLDIGCVDLNATIVSKVNECLQSTVQSNIKQIHAFYSDIHYTNVV